MHFQFTEHRNKKKEANHSEWIQLKQQFSFLFSPVALVFRVRIKAWTWTAITPKETKNCVLIWNVYAIVLNWRQFAIIVMHRDLNGLGRICILHSIKWRKTTSQHRSHKYIFKSKPNQKHRDDMESHMVVEFARHFPFLFLFLSFMYHLEQCRDKYKQIVQISMAIGIMPKHLANSRCSAVIFYGNILKKDTNSIRFCF